MVRVYGDLKFISGVGSIQFLGCAFMLEDYNFFSLELRGANLFQHVNAPVHNSWSMTILFGKFCVEVPPDLNPTELFWHEPEH